MRRVPLLLATLPVLVATGAVIAAPQATALGTLSDDAFYYLRIAQSIAAGRGCSFDGIAPTNGFHPLWMLCMVGISLLSGDAPMAPVIATIVLSGMLCGLTLLLLYRATDRWEAPGFGSVTVAVCLMPSLLASMINGMETGILLLAIALFVWCSHRHELLSVSAGARSKFCVGLLLGLIFLSRLDSAFVVLAAGVLVLAAGLIARTPVRTLLARWLTMVGGVLALAGPYFAWNVAAFGHWTPISGRVKTSFPEIRKALSLDGDMKLGLALLAIDLLLVLLLARIERRRGRDLASILASPLSVLVLGSFGHFAYTFLYMSWGVYWWHFVIYGVALALGAARLAEVTSVALPSMRRTLRFGLPALVGAAGLVGQGWFTADRIHRHGEWLEAAWWARDNTDEQAVFAMKDAGLFGYFSRRRVVNLDGKANGYGYLESLESENVVPYLEQARVSHVAEISAHYVEGRAPLALPRARQPWLTLWMPIEDEVYRSEPYPGHRLLARGSDSAHFAIWKFRPRERS